MISKKLAGMINLIGTLGLILASGLFTQAMAATPYDAVVEPLTTAECGQCHFTYFQAIKTDGGKHQIDCVRCHTVYHAYSPRKQNYDEVMPKCATCHTSASGGPFHGDNPALVLCLNCHVNPHTPLKIPASAIETACGLCHAAESREIQNYPSKHATDVSCADCHSEKHGYIPECNACHESHSPAVEMTSKECMTCHPVHKPTQIVYGRDTDSLICAGCHGAVYDLLQNNVTKHTALKCAECHPTHKEIPLCSRCHGEPHPKSMKVDVTKCGVCHGIAHNLTQ